MSTISIGRAAGILPDAVIRDPNANAYLIALTLAPQLDGAGVQTWLTELSSLITTLEQPGPGAAPVATAAVAFAASFFVSGGQPRFELVQSQVPAQLLTPPSTPALASVPQFPGDVLVYVMSTSEAAVAAFERGLSGTRTTGLASVTVENGFQRSDRREPFGFLDGLRNPAGLRREAVVFVDLDRSPEEPAWAGGGSYVAYIKIHQDLDAMAALSEAAQEEIIGRRKADGSRVDLPLGTPVAAEGVFAEAAACPITAHIRKAGPRGGLHDQTEIFRRGVLYLTLNPDATIDTGLQFVSFQRSLNDFAAIFARWMTNVDFPSTAAGNDALIANSLITLEKYGFYFVAPADPRFIGASMFDPPASDPCAVGEIVVQKQLVDANGQPVLAELGGISFQVLQNGQPFGSPFITDSTGRAISPKVPRNVPLMVHEVAPPPGFEAVADTSVTLSADSELVTIVNQLTPGPGPAPVYSA
jgi:deferrochelatase/peroxidase EfeB